MNGGVGGAWQPPEATGGAFTPPIDQQTPGPWGDHRAWGAAYGPQYGNIPAAPPVVPSAMQLATKLMFLGAGLVVVSLIVTLATADQLADALQEDSPFRSRVAIDREVSRAQTQAFFRTAIGVGLWIWMAIKNGEGRKWARIVGTIFGAINLLFTVVGLLLLASLDLGSNVVVPEMILEVVGIALAITIMVLFFRPESSRFYEDAERWKAATMLRGYA